MVKGPTEDESQMAVAAYKNDDAGLNKCAKMYSIPKARLKRHSENKNSNLNIVKVFGRPTVFDSNMEKQIVQHILHLESMFFGCKINDICMFTYDITEKYSLNHSCNRKKQIAGKKWFYTFMKRNPTLTLRQPKGTSMAGLNVFTDKT